MSKTNSKAIQLTPLEEELMTILWNNGPGTVHDVIAHLPSNRQLAYTSISTILRILEKKNILISKKSGRSHVYVPKVTLETYTQKTVNKIIKQSFAGKPLALANYLLDNYKLTSSEIDELETLIKEKLGQQS
ncbi:MAG: BlaI/MecI/CopY family transcriptional regulator [Pseudomonadota bacterium]